MTIEMKDLVSSLNEAAEEVKNLKANHERQFAAVDSALKELQAKDKRPVYGYETGDAASDPEMKSFLQKGVMPMETKDLSVTNDGQGVTVRSQWADRIFSQVRETSPIRAVANVMQTNSNELEVLVDRGEPSAEWIGELAARTDTAASYLTRHKIPVFEHYALPSITLQMIEDSAFQVESWLQGKMANKFSRQEASAFINGDGVGKPRGILNYGAVDDTTFTWGADPALYKIGALVSGVAGDLTDPDVLMNLVDSLKANYLPGAGWMMTRAMRNRVRRLKDNQNRYLFEASLQAGVPDTLLGFPVYLAEDMPAPADGVIGALFGNFQQAYTIVDRVGLTIQRDAVTKPGFVKYFARRRVGGALTNPEAVKALVLGTAIV